MSGYLPSDRSTSGYSKAFPRSSDENSKSTYQLNVSVNGTVETPTKKTTAPDDSFVVRGCLVEKSFHRLSSASAFSACKVSSSLKSSFSRHSSATAPNSIAMIMHRSPIYVGGYHFSDI